MRDDTALQEALEKVRTSSVKAGQRYRHFDSGDVYLVHDVGLFEADLEPTVSYSCCDRAGVRIPDATVWMRYLTIFRSRAVQNGTLVPRFTLVVD